MKIENDERVDDLQYKGLKVIQKIDGFCFGIDAVLVANFADIKKGDEVIDLGTGTGIIPILLAGKTLAKAITGLEIQPRIASMALRSVEMNSLEDRVKIVCGDIKEAVGYFGTEKFDVVITNPPYMNAGGGLVNPSDTKAISRHEILCTLEDVIKTASRLLSQRGRFVMVHRPDRLADIIYLMRVYHIEPKYIRLVHPSPGKKPNLMLIRGLKYGNPQLRVMEPLYVYDDKGNYTQEINMIYNRI